MTAFAQAAWAAPIIAALAWIGCIDARRFIIDLRLIAALVVALALWHTLGPGRAVTEASPINLAIAGGIGVATVAVPMIAARLAGTRLPILHGDAVLLGVVGLLLGVWGLALTMIVGSALAVLHRAMIQRRRGRPFAAGYTPAGTGFAAAAILVLMAMHVTPALAQGAARGPISAVEIIPPAYPLPPDVADIRVTVTTDGPVEFPALVGRLDVAAGIQSEIEERPSRVAGGAVVMPPAPAVTLNYEGALSGAIEAVTAQTGYSAEWRSGRLVWFRYWDSEQRLPVVAVQEPTKEEKALRRTEEATARMVAVHTGPPDPAAPAMPIEPEPEPEPWRISPARHHTVRGVLEDWSARAGWTLVWSSAHEVTLGAAAQFPGQLSFMEAVDRLVLDPLTVRHLSVTSHTHNRHLVVTDVDAGQ